MREIFKGLPLDKKIKYSILIIMFFPAILIIASIFIGVVQRSKESTKYRKVIKKGLFWDTEYLIEKE